MSKEDYGSHCVRQFARLFESEYHGVWDPKAGEAEFAAFYVELIQARAAMSSRPRTLSSSRRCSTSTASRWSSTRSRWALPHRQAVPIEHFGVEPDVIVFGKATTNGLNPLAGIWARES
jgi:hypothetical protein